MEGHYPHLEANAMSIYASDRRAAVIWTIVLAVFAAAPLFWWVQNNLQPVGGAMAFQKALWLADALVLWMVLPLCIVCDARVDASVKQAFRAVLILMLLRVVAEGWMLYVSHSWSTWYGIIHDLICIAVLMGYFAVVSGNDKPIARKPLWLTHMVATAAAFVPEIYFAWYMQANFHTRGVDAVYFVPDDPAHAFTLNVTSTAVVCFTAYILVFIFRWQHAASDGGSATAQ
jgi:hypothetical protein